MRFSNEVKAQVLAETKEVGSIEAVDFRLGKMVENATK